MKFLLHYLLTAFVLGAIIWFGVPVVKAPAAGMQSSIEEPAPAAFDEPREPSADNGRQSSTAIDSYRRTPPEASVAPAPAPTPAPAPAPAQPTTSLAEYAPGQEPRQASYDGPRYDWGILMRAAQAYTLEGTPRVQLPGGTVVEKMSERRAKSGDMMLICRIRDNRRWQEGFVFHSADVVQFQGPFAFAPKKASDQIIDYFTKVDLREKRMAAIREEHLRKNPYLEAYQSAARAYKEFQESAKELTARRDAAVGAERSRLIRELEAMKSRQPRLHAELEKAEIPYKQWKKQHGDGTDEINADPVVQKLDGEIKALYEEVADMVPGL